MELYLHSQYAFVAWCLVKTQEQLYLYFYFLNQKETVIGVCVCVEAGVPQPVQ
jgi:hypothetical protein